MRSIQNGFTLIELMIVVAIISILVSILIPAYSGYTDRTKITEVMLVADGAKTAVSEYFMSMGQMPADSAEANVNTDPTQSDYISAITYAATATTATITYTLGNLNASGDIALVGTASASGVQWSCNTAATTVDSVYLPINCRS